jgi:hypothetical protein
MKRVALFLALLLPGCARETKWTATGTVLEIYSRREGWVSCSDCYTVIFQQDDGIQYSIANVAGPPPVWKGLHATIQVTWTSSGGFWHREITVVHR